MSTTRRTRRGWGVLVLAALLALVGYLTISICHHRKSAPPSGVKTLEQFAAAMPPPLYLRIGNAQGKEYLVWSAPIMSTVFLSGPPGYAFDDAGALVDWSTDQEDDLGFREKWPTDSRNSITLVEALKRFKSR